MPPPDDSEWLPPRWVPVHKHHSRASETWDEILDRSSGRYGNGIYRIERVQVQQVELETVADARNEIEKRKAPTVRHFWRKLAEEVGASKGERTPYIYVQYDQSGAVHGYPITEALLRAKGVNP